MERPMDLADVRKMMSTFLRDCDLKYSRPQEHPEFEAEMIAECMRRGYTTAEIDRMMPFIQTGVSMARNAFHFQSHDIQVFVSLYTTSIVYMEEKFERDMEEVLSFNQKFITRDRQKDPIIEHFADLLREMPALFGEVEANLILISTLNLFIAFAIEHEFKHVEVRLPHLSSTPRSIISDACCSWSRPRTCFRASAGPCRVRERLSPSSCSGGSFPFAGSSRHYPTARYSSPTQSRSRALPSPRPRLSRYLGWPGADRRETNTSCSDVLSFYKEQLYGETANQVTLISKCRGIDAGAALKELADKTTAAHLRALRTLTPNSEALEAYKSFSQGYVGFHTGAKRYRLEELGMGDGLVGV
ncbi:hypothetical protein GGS23DRAFT_572416 [Durotheca rogersii]|uniref:uncharacterized protein n=1 Tax=Durotheca rogersii TaxID=419775 RepID=UPI00221E61A7|nr:uncharacterized protein GGS23DRAFT_572416 [Durotheca rogersii]KAI5862449.1 hypothetical protein GGS23DRAFT_572416 [Durotheca rogersii]